MAVLASIRKRERCYWSIWADSSKSLVLVLYEHTLRERQRERRRERESTRDTQLECPGSTASALILTQRIMDVQSHL